MNDVPNNHPRIRTFASDMEAVRKHEETGDGTGQPSAPVTKKSESEKKLVPKKPLPKPKSSPEPTPAPTAIPPQPKRAIPSPKSADTTPSKPPATRIPAFHELQKQVTTLQKGLAENAAPSAKTEHIVAKKSEGKQPPRANIGFDSKIITDTKRNRFKLFPAIVQSVKEWFKKLKVNRKRKRAPKYTVTETERRKGVIQKATSKTGTAFTADNETLKEQIRRRNQQHQAAAEMEDEEAELNWSPYTETGYDLLEAPDSTQNIAVTYKQQHVTQAPKPTKEPPVITEPTPPEPSESEAASIEEARWANADIEEAAAESAPTPTTPAEPLANDTAPATSNQSAATPTRLLERTDTNTLTLLSLISIIGFVAVLGASYLIIQHFTSSDTAEEPIEITTDPIFSTASLSPIILTPSNLSELEGLMIAAATEAPSGLVELPILSPTNEEVSASYIFDLLDLDTTASFRQSLTSVRPVTINNSAPQLLLQFVDIDTIRGGFLRWEPAMASDLRVLYRVPPEASESGTFVDETIRDIDVRVLRYNDKAVLVYGIVGNNTALITKSTADFAQIIELANINN